MYCAKLYNDNTFEISEVDDKEAKGWKGVLFFAEDRRCGIKIYKKTKAEAVSAMREHINAEITRFNSEIRRLKKRLEIIKED